MGAARAVTGPGTRPAGPRVLRAASGALCAGLVLLALLLLGVWVVALAGHFPGPRPRLLVGHLVAAGVAVGLQRVADRRAGRLGAVAAAGVWLVTAAVAVVFWWT